MGILSLTNSSEPPTDVANCLPPQKALNNGDADLLYLKTNLGIINKPTYAKLIKAEGSVSFY
jgi:hypothetical protein